MHIQKRVDLHFAEDTVVIVDDGKPECHLMTYRSGCLSHIPPNDGSKTWRKDPPRSTIVSAFPGQPAYAGRALVDFSRSTWCPPYTSKQNQANQKSITRAEISWSLFEANQEDEFCRRTRRRISATRFRRSLRCRGTRARNGGSPFDPFAQYGDRDKLLKLRAHFSQAHQPI